MTESILNGTKKLLGIKEDYDAFDLDILMHINSVLSTLQQLGVGPSEGYVVYDEEATWGDYLGGWRPETPPSPPLTAHYRYVLNQLHAPGEFLIIPDVWFVFHPVDLGGRSHDWVAELEVSDVIEIDGSTYTIESINRAEGGMPQGMVDSLLNSGLTLLHTEPHPIAYAIPPARSVFTYPAPPPPEKPIRPPAMYSAVRSYVYLRVKLLFDPPSTSFGITAIEEQIKELEWRLNVVREGELWTSQATSSTSP
jgi:hypothetical protein